MSNRSTSLSADHYAHGWPTTDTNDKDSINQLAILYSSLPDGAEKEAKCLEIIRAFHPYIMKYLNMIVRGHLPALRTPAGKDASKMLSTLVPRGKKATRESLSQACRTMHLAFKQNTADDIYDTLVMCIMKAVRKYDPHYTNKVRLICNIIAARSGRIISESEITQSVGFNSLSCLRMLVRRGYLASVAGSKKKVVGYQRAKEWPPAESFFNSGPVGFVYFLPMYFRYYLHEHISGAMSSIESKEGVLQLEHRYSYGLGGDSAGNFPDHGIPHADGDFTDRSGHSWAADIGLLNLPLDISRINTAWVKSTPDKLFRKLTVRERYVLYLIYVKELKWNEVATTLAVDVATARRIYDQVMAYLKARASARRPKGSSSSSS